MGFDAFNWIIRVIKLIINNIKYIVSVFMILLFLKLENGKSSTFTLLYFQVIKPFFIHNIVV